MKIAFDAQLLFEKQKTGIGWTAEYILLNIIKEFNNEYFLNYFSLHHPKEKDRIIKEYLKLGYKRTECKWFHNVIYRKIWNAVPIPYSLFFHRKTQITQFFNYDIPPGVKGVSVTFVYDMVYKAIPETVSEKTMGMLDQNLERTCRRANHIITISQFSKNEIIKYMNIPSEKISIMPCGVDLERYHTNYSISSIERAKMKYNIQGDYILYLGTLEPRKNIARLIDSYAALKKQATNPPKLVLAGKKGWLYDNIFEKVTELQLFEDVIFTDYIDEEDTPLLLKGALVFVFPSLYEGFGLPPLEAMACGTPVIVSNKASLPEVVGKAGYYIDPYSVEEIKNALILLINDESLRISMSEKGLVRAQSFSWKSSVMSLINIYKKILE